MSSARSDITYVDAEYVANLVLNKDKHKKETTKDSKEKQKEKENEKKEQKGKENEKKEQKEKENEKKETFAIIDVRDEDFRGGNIHGAVNHPSSSFSDNIQDIINTNKDKDFVIFHCMRSQQRGPFCAAMFAAELAKNKEKPKCKVNILSQGFEGFLRYVRSNHKNDFDKIIENYSKRDWEFNKDDE